MINIQDEHWLLNIFESVSLNSLSISRYSDFFKGCCLTDETVNDAIDHLLDYLHQDVSYWQIIWIIEWKKWIDCKVMVLWYWIFIWSFTSDGCECGKIYFFVRKCQNNGIIKWVKYGRKFVDWW